MSVDRKIVSRLLLNRPSWLRIAALLLAQIVGVVIIVSSINLSLDAPQSLKAMGGEQGYVVITQKIGTLTGLFGSGSSSGVDSRKIEQLAAVEGVQSVGEFVASNFAVESSIGVESLGVSYRTDMFFEAIDSKFLDVDVEGWGFTPGQKSVPIIIPQNYINLYNFGFAPSSGLPKLSKELIQSVKFKIMIRDNSGFPHVLDGKIVGFSQRINTILAPLEFVEWGNKEFSRGGKIAPSRLILEINPARSTFIAERVDKLGFDIESQLFNMEGVNAIVKFVVLGVMLIGLIITLLSVALLLAMIFLLIERHRAKIENLFLLGFTMRDIYAPYMRFAAWSISTGFALGYIVAAFIRDGYRHSIIELLRLKSLEFNVVVPLIFSAAILALILGAIHLIIKSQIRKIQRR